MGFLDDFKDDVKSIEEIIEKNFDPSQTLSYYTEIIKEDNFYSSLVPADNLQLQLELLSICWWTRRKRMALYL